MNLGEIGLLQLSTTEAQEIEGGLQDWVYAMAAVLTFGSTAIATGIYGIGFYNGYHNP